MKELGRFFQHHQSESRYQISLNPSELPIVIQSISEIVSDKYVGFSDNKSDRLNQLEPWALAVVPIREGKFYPFVLPVKHKALRMITEVLNHTPPEFIQYMTPISGVTLRIIEEDGFKVAAAIWVWGQGENRVIEIVAPKLKWLGGKALLAPALYFLNEVQFAQRDPQKLYRNLPRT